MGNELLKRASARFRLFAEPEMSMPATPTTPAGAMTLRQRVLNAGGWSVAGFAASQGLRLASNLVMTRLLAPEMWGVLSVAFTLMMVVTLFMDIGLNQSVVQNRRGNDPLFLNTVWVTRIGISVGLLILMVSIAAGLSLADSWGLVPSHSTYAAPELPLVLVAVGLSTMISGFGSTKALEATRRLSIARVTQIGLVAQVASLISMLLAAAFTRTIWVLMTGYVVNALVTTVLTHVWLPGTRNRLHWDAASFRELLHFGKWILGASSIGVVAAAMDPLLLAAIVPATVLGLYSIATLLYFAVAQLIEKVIGEVSFPALSEIARERIADLPKVLYRFHTPLAAVVYGVAGLLFVTAPTIISILYDSRYRDAGWMLQTISLGLIALPARIHGAALLARGFSKVAFIQSVVAFVTVVVAMPLGYAVYDLPGALCGVVARQLSNVPIALWFSARYDMVHWGREALPLPGFVFGVVFGYVLLQLLPA